MSSLRGKIFPCVHGCGRDDFDNSAQRDRHEKRCSGVAGEEVAESSSVSQENEGAEQRGTRKRKNDEEEMVEEETEQPATLDDLLDALHVLTKHVESLARNVRVIKRRTSKPKTAAEQKAESFKNGYFTSALSAPTPAELADAEIEVKRIYTRDVASQQQAAEALHLYNIRQNAQAQNLE